VQTPVAARTAEPPSGVIETLTAGYTVINRRPWILLLPLLIDLFLWLGPQVSLSPLVDPLVVRVTEMAQLAQPQAAAPDPDMAAAFDATRSRLMTLSTETNALVLLARGPLDVPSVAVLLGGVGVFSFAEGWGSGLALAGSALAAGLAAGALLRGLIAQQVRDGRSRLVDTGQRVPRDVLRVLGLIGLVLALVLVLGIPALLTLAAAATVAPAVAILGIVLLSIGTLFAEVHLFFAVDAIFVSDVGPLAAIQRSVGVVRRHLWATVGLVSLSWLILAGMEQVWAYLAQSVTTPFGVALGMLGNAYIGSGLLAASMVFYKERADQARAGSTPAPAAYPVAQ
jgi:hypothetical protein